MLESILAGLVLAGVSAMVFLAYHHPAQFHKVMQPVMWAALAIIIGAQIWSSAIAFAKNAIYDKVKDAKVEDVGKALDPLSINPVAIAVAIPAVIVFFAVLSLWVTKLKHDKKDDKSDQEKS
jgi:xanthine/uracil permease